MRTSPGWALRTGCPAQAFAILDVHQARVVRVDPDPALGDQSHGTRQQPVLDHVHALLDLGDAARIGSANDSCRTIGPLSTPSSTK